MMFAIILNEIEEKSANDPEMQDELKKIDQEFAVTEADGLARV